MREPVSGEQRQPSDSLMKHGEEVEDKKREERGMCLENSFTFSIRIKAGHKKKKEKKGRSASD